MEELITSLADTVRVSLEDDDVALVHPHYKLYKSKGSLELKQEERRREWLQHQKEKRLDRFCLDRGIAEFEEEKVNNTKRTKETKRPFKDWIMLSHWLVDVPQDLETDWLFLPCPSGKRALVVATDGTTSAYSRRGSVFMKFPSALPGGSRSHNAGQRTIIDAVFDFESQIFFILDVLIWGIPMKSCSAEFRFFWLQNKVNETPELAQKTNSNRHQFVLVDHKLASKDLLQQTLSTHPLCPNNKPPLDGILFYHKESLYTGGKSPLVNWLKPFMIQQILGIPVHSNYFNEIPPNYSEAVQKMETENVDPTEVPENCV